MLDQVNRQINIGSIVIHIWNSKQQKFTSLLIHFHSNSFSCIICKSKCRISVMKFSVNGTSSCTWINKTSLEAPTEDTAVVSWLCYPSDLRIFRIMKNNIPSADSDEIENILSKLKLLNLVQYNNRNRVHWTISVKWSS